MLRKGSARIQIANSSSSPRAALTTFSSSSSSSVRHGVQPLGLQSSNDGCLFVPKSYDPAKPSPFMVLLHGAGGSAQGILPILVERAQADGVIVLAPSSAGRTWDFLVDYDFGTDVSFIERAMNHVFSRYNIDPKRTAIGGFSDGASYALTLGLTNGNLFSHVVAYSPGFLAPPTMEGSPKIYVSHGVDDQVLPIQRCSRRIVPSLQRRGYAIDYTEFAGSHTVPQSIVAESMSWFLDGSSYEQ